MGMVYFIFPDPVQLSVEPFGAVQLDLFCDLLRNTLFHETSELDLFSTNLI